MHGNHTFFCGVYCPVNIVCAFFAGVSLKGYLVPTYDLEEQAPPKTKKSRAKRTTSQEAVTATDDDFEKLTIGDSSYEEEWSE